MTAFKIAIAGSLSGTSKAVPSGSSSVFIRSAGTIPKPLRKIHLAPSHVAGFAGPYRTQDDEFGRLVHHCVGAFVLGVKRAHDARYVLVGRGPMVALRPLGIRQ